MVGKTDHKAIQAWVREAADMFQPAPVCWRNGGEDVTAAVAASRLVR